MKRRNRKLCKFWHEGEGRKGGYCGTLAELYNGVKFWLDADCNGPCKHFREKENTKDVKK